MNFEAKRLAPVADRLAWVRDNIDYDERNPGALIPEIIMDDGSLRCEGMEWTAGSDTIYITKPFDICEVEGFAQHAFEVNAARSYGSKTRMLGDQIRRVLAHGHKPSAEGRWGQEMFLFRLTELAWNEATCGQGMPSPDVQTRLIERVRKEFGLLRRPWWKWRLERFLGLRTRRP